MTSPTKRRIYNLLDSQMLRPLTVAGIRVASRLIRLDPAIKRRVDQLLDEQPVNVAGSIVGWVATLRLRKAMPRYSIRDWLDGQDQRQSVVHLLETVAGSNSDVRQEALLLGGNAIDEDVRELAHEYLGRRFLREGTESRISTDTFNSSGAAAALADTATAFSIIGGTMFLVSGTYLGAVREGRFLSTDYDVDVGYFADEIDIDHIYRAMVEMSEFREVQCSRPWMIKATHQTGVRVDVFAHFVSDDGTVVHGSATHHWWNTAFDLAPVELDGVEYLGPTDADRYLRENYGNWKTPVAFWDWAVDTPNRRTPATPDALFKLVDYAIGSNDRKRAEMALLELRDVFGIDYTDYLPGGGRSSAPSPKNGSIARASRHPDAH